MKSEVINKIGRHNINLLVFLKADKARILDDPSTKTINMIKMDCELYGVMYFVTIFNGRSDFGLVIHTYDGMVLKHNNIVTMEHVVDLLWYFALNRKSN
jgi:hypothetical protein